MRCLLVEHDGSMLTRIDAETVYETFRLHVKAKGDKDVH